MAQVFNFLKTDTAKYLLKSKTRKKEPLNTCRKNESKIVSKQEAQRERVYKFYNDHKKNGKLFTVNNFKAEHIPKRTIG
jgi:hypothetical protein